MTRDEELLNEIIQRRGYIVVCCFSNLKIGQPTPIAMADKSLDTKAHWYVLAETNEVDMLEQIRLLRLLRPDLPPDNLLGLETFYRVLSD